MPQGQSDAGPPDAKLIAEWIDTERMEMRFHIGLAALFLVLGLGFIVVSYLMTGVKPTDLKDAGQYLLGLFASALSAYPLSQFSARRNKIATLKHMGDAMAREGGRGAAAFVLQEYSKMYGKTLGGK